MSGAPTLVAVAHGSRDPRSATTVAAIVDRVRALRPGTAVRTAFLDLNEPSVEQVLDSLAARGETHAVAVPLLLGNAFHARVDLPGILAAAAERYPWQRVTQAQVLGADPRLISVLRDRVLAACATTGTPPTTDRPAVAVAAVGSSSPTANIRTMRVARHLAAWTGWRTETCFATAEPDITQAVTRLRERGADHIVVAPWFLAPGLLTDRLRRAAPDVVHADVLGDHHALAEIVWNRYDSAIADRLPLSA
ncbi:sirohydrochlorin chelatase [Nocardia paucivorans]|uniref:sirohydrochlorin chelatase n=1 Tax=Nocardia paucivorans TaxID=114259 RepID=UPI0002EF1FCE|nr:sirohydrochlorin chelatase [Nocardia paucivorans]